MSKPSRRLKAPVLRQRAIRPRARKRPRGRELVPVRGSRAALLGASSEIAVQRADGTVKYRAPAAYPRPKRKELDPVDYIVRNGVITLFAHRLKKSGDEVRQSLYGDDQMTKACFQFIQKAATAPAMTNVPTWAEELVTQTNVDFMPPLMPQAIFPQLAARGMTLDFGRAGRIAVPTRSRTRTIAGSFIGEGQPIPVRQGMFTATILTPKKLGVITVMTREIEEHSVPAIEALLRDAISEDTGESIDSVLLDANPATVVRPPGIRNGIPATPPTAVGADPTGVQPDGHGPQAARGRPGRIDRRQSEGSVLAAQPSADARYRTRADAGNGRVPVQG